MNLFIRLTSRSNFYRPLTVASVTLSRRYSPMNCPELHAAIRNAGDRSTKQWARATLIYFDENGENVASCLVKPDRAEPSTAAVTPPPEAHLSFGPSVP